MISAKTVESNVKDLYVILCVWETKCTKEDKKAILFLYAQMTTKSQKKKENNNNERLNVCIGSGNALYRTQLIAGIISPCAQRETVRYMGEKNSENYNVLHFMFHNEHSNID